MTLRGLLAGAICLGIGGTNPAAANAQQNDVRGDSTAHIVYQCCADWIVSADPVRLHGSTYYVGTEGLASVLIASPAGHILIDGGLAETAPQIMRSIRALGFRVEDIRLIVNSHPHYDHAGGIAAIQRASNALVAASPRAAPVLRSGRTGPDDPQHAIALSIPAVARVRVIRDGETLAVGKLRITAHFTPGHAPGGTSWSWRSCEDSACVHFVYADSQTPVSSDSFLFSRSTTYPGVIDDFRRGLAVISELPCDVLLTPHPAASMMWARVRTTDRTGFVDPSACRRYASHAADQLDRRLAGERAAAEGIKR